MLKDNNLGIFYNHGAHRKHRVTTKIQEVKQSIWPSFWLSWGTIAAINLVNTPKMKRFATKMIFFLLKSFLLSTYI